MLPAKYQSYRPGGSGKEYFEWFLPYMDMVAERRTDDGSFPSYNKLLRSLRLRGAKITLIIKGPDTTLM